MANEGTYGNIFDRLANTMQSPLFQMGAGVMDAGWHGQGFGAGIMQGAQNAQRAAKGMREQKQWQAQDQFMQQLGSGQTPDWAKNVPMGVIQVAQATGNPSLISDYITKQNDPSLGLKREELELQKKKTDAEISKWGTTDDIKEYEFARQKGYGGGFDQWMQLKRSQGLGRTPIFGTDAQGNAQVFQLGEGSMVPAKLPPGYSIDPKNPLKIDTGTGTKVLGADGRVIADVPKDIAGAKREGEIGEGQGKRIANLPKAQLSLQQLDLQQGIVNEDIDRALNGVKWGTTGWRGAAGSYVPGSDAYNLNQLLGTIKANIGFDKLQAMREASPTGGALGAISDFENKMLQSVMGNIEQSQSEPQLRQNLTRLKTVLAQTRAMRQRAYEQDAALASSAAQPKQPANGGWSIERAQ